MKPSSFGPRRFLIAFAAALLCGLAVFSLPRILYNTVAPAFAQQPPAGAAAAPATLPAAPVVTAPVQDTTPPPRVAMPVTAAMRLTGLIGIVMVLGIGFLFSHNRKAIDWRVIGTGLLLQVLFAIFVLRVPAGQTLFRHLAKK